jgi:hypothetical protein
MTRARLIGVFAASVVVGVVAGRFFFSSTAFAHNAGVASKGERVTGVAISPSSVSTSFVGVSRIDAGTIYADKLILDGGVSQIVCSYPGIFRIDSSAPDSVTSTTVAAIELTALVDITSTDQLMCVKDSSANRRMCISEGGTLALTGTNQINNGGGNMMMGLNAGAATGLRLNGDDSHSSSSVAVTLHNETTLTTAGGRIVSFKNGRSGSQKSSIDVLTGAYLADVQAFSIADDGAGTNAAGTLTPTSTYITATCLDAHGCDVTMGETGMQAGTIIYVSVLTGAAGASESNFADSAGVSELAGAFAAETNDTLVLLYTGATWVEITRSDN